MTQIVASTTLSQAISTWRKEIDTYYDKMEGFENDEIRSILISLGSFAARVDHMRLKVIRSTNPEAKRFRLDEIDPFLSAVDRQFKIWSRIQSQVEAEWKMSGQ